MATNIFPLILVFLTVHGFLLDKSQSTNGQLGTSNQYVTAFEFLGEMKSRHQEDEQIRHYVDKSLAILSSQLEQKFNTLEQKLIKCENQSASTLSSKSLELKYVELERKYNQLQTENKAQTNSLSVNERARSQEFLALYNMTIDSKRVMSELNTSTFNHLKNLETKTSNQLYNLELRQNSTAADIITRMEAKETSDNVTMTMVQKQINNNAEIVAMTAHPSSPGTISNNIMKFDDVKFSVGITNLTAYKNTGKFTCEQEGLYIISVSVTSHTSGATYSIRRNGNIISQTYIGTHNSYNAHTGAVTVTWKLNLNDQVWLYATGSWYLFAIPFSTLTINKVK